MRRVLVTGAAGMLGSELLAQAPAGTEAVGTDLVSGVDLAEPAAVERLFREQGPFTGVIHCAAFTAVPLSLVGDSLSAASVCSSHRRPSVR